MIKKKLLVLTTTAMLTMAVFAGCSNKAASTTLKDGEYTKVAAEADKSGYTYEMTMTVKDGKIAEVVYDAKDADGQSKAKLAEEGKYVMTETGLKWSEQSDLLSKYLVEKQTLTDLKVNDDKKTDAIAGVSVKVDTFVEFANELIEKAGK